MYHSYQDIAERCLTQVHGKRYETGKLTKGWNEGTPAHRRALAWTEHNFDKLKVLPWPVVFRNYLRACKRTSETYDHF